MQTKTCSMAVKAVGTATSDLGVGQFEAIVSVFGNEDRVGDVVLAGAFANTLKAWEEKGDPIPLVWAHEWNNPKAHIGRVLKAEEREAGLWVRGQIDDLDTNDFAAHVYRLLKGRRVTQFSFAYDVIDAGWGKRDDRDVYELRELRLIEVGPCLAGVNPETELEHVKAWACEAAKAGRVLSQKNLDRLSEAHAALGDVLAAATVEDSGDAAPKASEPSGSENQTDEPSQADASATSDEKPDGAKSDEPAPSAPRRALQVSVLFST